MSYYVQNVEQLASFIRYIRPPSRNFLVVVCGAPLSGKTYLSTALLRELDAKGVPVPILQGKPFPIGEGEFLRGDLKEFLERTGGMILHPKVVDVEGLKEVVHELLNGNGVELIRYIAEGGEVKKIKLQVTPPRSGVIAVEGSFACKHLKDLTDLSVFIDVPSAMEIILRRIVKAAYGLTTEEALKYMSYSQVLWELFGKEQRKNADVVYMNAYRVLEDIGREDYQVKVCINDFARKFPHIYEELRGKHPYHMEDVIATEGSERIRGRLIYSHNIPAAFEVSYRRFIPDKFPYLRRVSYEFSPNMFLPFVTALRVAGLEFKSVVRDITWVVRDGVKYKLYEDKNVIEIETGDRTKMDEFVRLFKGVLIFKSYYTAKRLCGE